MPAKKPSPPPSGGAPREAHCRSCGAVFSTELPACPYCGTMYLPAAEKAYMNRLEHVRSGLEELGATPAKKMKSNLLTLHKQVLVAALLLLLAVFSVFVVNEVKNRREEEQDRAEAIWQLDYFKKLDAAYDAGDYALLDELYSAAQDEGHRVWNYKHWRFCDIHLMIARTEEVLQQAGTSLADNAWVLYTGVHLLDLENQEPWLSAEEYARLQELRAPALDAVTERFALTEEEIAAFRSTLKSGYVSYDDCESFLKDRGNQP